METVRAPVMVLPEVVYLLMRQIGHMPNSSSSGPSTAESYPSSRWNHSDIVRAAEIMSTCVDTPVGFVDASIVGIAERLA